MQNICAWNITFSISTGMAVLAILVHLLLANHAFSISVRGPSASNQFKIRTLITEYSWWNMHGVTNNKVTKGEKRSPLHNRYRYNRLMDKNLRMVLRIMSKFKTEWIHIYKKGMAQPSFKCTCSCTLDRTDSIPECHTIIDNFLDSC